MKREHEDYWYFYLCPLHVVNAELLHLKLAFYQQVFLLSICKEEVREWIPKKIGL